MKKYATVDGYLKDQSRPIQAALKSLRSAIRKAAPKAVESMSYGMPGYAYEGRPLVYFAAWKEHIGFYALPSGNAAFKKDLSKYKVSKGTVQFPLDTPLPLALIARMVRFRLKENARKK
jgi:uncharacterized protein YdhG (YjbR/CyaY superfamily)